MASTLPDLDDLALLVLVAQSGSIGLAAQKRGLSQPQVSRCMAALERRLGVDVLERSTRGASLTPTGRVLVDWAESLLLAANEFNASVRNLQEAGDHAITVGVSMTIAEHLAPQWLRALRTLRPKAQVSLKVSNSSEVVESVEAGRAVLGYVESPQIAATLRARRIARDELAIAVSPRHPWAKHPTVKLSELNDGGLLVREQGSGTRETLEHVLRQRHVELAPALEMASTTALRSAALAGLGPAVLSLRSVADDLRSGRLVRVRVVNLTLRRDFTAVWLPGTKLSRTARELLDISGDPAMDGGAARK